MKRLLTFSCFCFLLSSLSYATSSSEDLNICYFSLNNEKEFQEMERFTEKLKKDSSVISVKEYMENGKDPKDSFKKMLESKDRCDGVVISGHHTGAFGGKRANGNLDINFLEEMSCKEEYKPFFLKVKSLWLQGCRTLGVGEYQTRGEETADFHTNRVGAVLEEDHLEQSLAELNVEFSEVLDADNTLPSRYLRVFPQATVFGWTRSAPGDISGSQYSIPFHIAHVAQTRNSQLPEESPIKQSWKESSSILYKESLESLFYPSTNNQCVESVESKQEEVCTNIGVAAWKSHGNVLDQDKEYGFLNPDLQAYSSLSQMDELDGSILKTAHSYTCLIRNKPEEIFEVLDDILEKPEILRYTYNSLFHTLKNLKKYKKDEEEFRRNKELYFELIETLKQSENMNEFLYKKLTGKRIGVLSKIDYLAFYQELYGKKEKLNSILIDKVVQIFKKPYSSNRSSRSNEIDYKLTLINALKENGYFKDKKGVLVLNQGIKDEDHQVRYAVISQTDELIKADMKEEALSILDQGMKDEDRYVVLTTLRRTNKLIEADMKKEALSFLNQGIRSKDGTIRSIVIHQTDELIKLGMKKEALSLLKQGMKDEHRVVREAVIHKTDNLIKLGMKKEALSFLKQEMKDENRVVRAAVIDQMDDLIKAGMKRQALSLLKQGMKDEHHEVREAVIRKTDNLIKLGMKKEYLSFLKQEMKDENRVVRAAVINQMDDLIKAGMKKEALSFLNQGIKDENRIVRQLVIRQTDELIEAGMKKEALSFLKQGIKDENHKVRRFVISQTDELIKLGMKKEALSILNEGMKSRYKTIRDLSEETYNKYF